MTKEPEVTEQQRSVLRSLIYGLPENEIARELNISDAALKRCIGELFSLLKVHNRTQAVYAVALLGMRLK